MKMNKIILLLLGLVLLSCNNNPKSKAESKMTNSKNQAFESKPNSEIKGDFEINTNDKCSCFKGIGSSKRDKPLVISNFSNGSSISICGYLEEKIQEAGFFVSEFNVFNCMDGSILVEYDALQLCKIEKSKNDLTIKELKYLPIGKDWEWGLLKIGKQIISEKNGELSVSDQYPELGKVHIPRKSAKGFLDSLKQGAGFGPEWESDIGKLEVLSLIGNDRAWQILSNYEEFSGERTDGALAEQWKEAVASVEWIAGK